MVQTKTGASHSNWISFIKEKSKEYHEQKKHGMEQPVEKKKIQTDKKRKIDVGTTDRGAKAPGR